MHILLPETDNCPSWISGREKMTVENISWSISTKECCRPRRGLNPRPPGLQSDGASNWATEAGRLYNVEYSVENNIGLVLDLLKSASGAMTKCKIVCAHRRRQTRQWLKISMARLPRLIRTHFLSPKENLPIAKKKFSYFIMKLRLLYDCQQRPFLIGWNWLQQVLTNLHVC